MENNSSFETKFLSVDLEFWKENLKYENKRLEELIVFSNGAEHSGTMDARRNIKRFELKIAELEEKLSQTKSNWTVEEILRREG